MDRIQEIETRFAQIKAELETDNADVTALTKEFDDLTEERKGLLAQREQRKNLLSRIAGGAGKPLGTPPEERGEPKDYENRDKVLTTPEYRSAFAKRLMGRKLTDPEERALNTALTTTATTYVAPTASVDGVNNGGLFIPTEINLALMEVLSLVSPIFRDAAKTAIAGMVKFPYTDTASSAGSQAEGTDTDQMSIKWAELTLTTAEISATIRVSWKLEAMAVDQFLTYLQQELIDQVQDGVINQTIYGTGNDSTAGRNQLTGITVGAKTQTYTTNTGVLEGIEAGLKKLTAKQKVGAKIYLSTSAAEEISFAQDSTGQYLYSPINSVGLKSMAGYPLEVDPYLHDGDFVIGNVARTYRFNTNEGMTVARDVSGKQRITDYTGYTLVSGAPKPNNVVYGSLTT